MNDVLKAQRAWHETLDGGDSEAIMEAGQAAILGVGPALEALQVNLRALGYPVQRFVTPCAEGLDARLEQLRTTSITVPDSLQALWRHVGGISVLDDSGFAHARFWSEFGCEAEVCDGVYVEPCSDEEVELYASDLNQYEAWARRAGPGDKGPPGFPLEISPDCYHKDNYSGGDAFSLLATAGWSAPMLFFGWVGAKQPQSARSHDPDLVSYLRSALLECAGFPGLLGDPAFERVRAKLLEAVPLF